MNEPDLATAVATEGVKQVGQVVPDVYKDAVQPAAQAGGKALGTLMNAFNMLLAPLERAQLRSEAKTERLRQELAKGFEEIPEERRVEPPLEIVGPALESLKYVTDEKLQNTFVQLLLASMDSNKQSRVHRAFVKIIEEINPIEAKMLKEINEGIFSIVVAVRTYGYLRPKRVYWVPLYCAQSIGLDNFLGGYITQLEKRPSVRNFDFYGTSLDNFERLNLIKAVECNSAALKDFLKDIIPLDSLYFGSAMAHIDFEYSNDLDIVAHILNENIFTREDVDRMTIEMKQIQLTNFGRDFCQICIK